MRQQRHVHGEPTAVRNGDYRHREPNNRLIEMPSYITQRPFTIQRQDRDDIAILFVSGQVQSAQMARLEAELDKLQEDHRKRVIVDFSGVKTASSLSMAGLPIFGESFRAGGGELKLTGFSYELAKVVEMLRIAATMDVQPNLDAAMKAFSSAPPPPSAHTPVGGN